MKLEKRKPSGREKDEASIELLEQLREKLYVRDISAARRAAFVLSWQQEDGLDILKEALYNDSPKVTKIAAVYGLRSMHGRMKKIALEILKQGLKHRKVAIREACDHALTLASQKKVNSVSEQSRGGKIEIREVTHKRKSRGRYQPKRARGQRHLR